MKRFVKAWAVGFTLAIGVALAQGTLKLSINTQTSAIPALIVKGKTYIPLEALEKAGVRVTRSSGALALTLPGQSAEGGANQRPSLEGCLGETLFNGVWRIRTSKLERITRDANTPGWALTVEVKNGTKSQLAMTDTGVGGAGQGMQLAFSDASTINVDGLEVQKLTFASLPPGGQVTVKLPFYYPFGTLESAVQPPTKFLLEINPKGFEDGMRKRGAVFSVPNPSLRVRLDCGK
jgi:hypothetical protein